MYLSRIQASSQTDQLRRLAHIAGGGQYRIHQALWNLFDRDPDASRDFLYRQEGQADKLSFLVLSKREPNNNEGLWSVQTKAFAPRLKVGQRLRFSVRVNPVIKRRDESGKQVRHDLVMDLRKRSGEAERSQAELVQQATRQWLSTRAEANGFTVHANSLIGEAYRQGRFKGKGGRSICFSTIDCAGLLTVADIERFQALLFSGLGPAKAFGCGLFLIRPD